MFAPQRNKEEIIDIRQKHLNPSLSVSYDEPLKIVRGEGVWLYDENNNAYLDLVNNVCHVGHCHPSVVKAATEQLSILNTNTRYLHDYLAEYAIRLTETFPDPLSVVFFVCSGSEANELALRLASTATNGSDVIALDGAYHGNTQRLIDISAYKHDGPGGTGAPNWVQKIPIPDTYRGEFHKQNIEKRDAGEFYASYIDPAIKTIAENGNTLSAFICESLLGCGGQMPLPDGYLSLAYQKVRAAGGVTIADEVQTGFGRCGKAMWAFELQNVIPDIVTLGKPMGNGHPLAAVVTTKEIANRFNTGMEYFNTFAGNPVSCAIGLSVLNVIENEKLQHNALMTGNYLKSKLIELKTGCTFFGDVRGEGLFIGVDIVNNDDERIPNAEVADNICQLLRRKRVLLSTDGPEHNVLKIKPPIVFNKDHADLFIQHLHDVLIELGIYN